MREKECFKCQRTLPLDQFYKHAQMGDGHLNKCKDCAKRDVAQNYQSKKLQYQQYERERFQRPERKAKNAEYQRRQREQYPEKAKARHAVSNAVRDGRLLRQPCEVCGDLKSEAHHEDYSKPLDVRWLCFRCHRAAHGQEVILALKGDSSNELIFNRGV